MTWLALFLTAVLLLSLLATIPLRNGLLLLVGIRSAKSPSEWRLATYFWNILFTWLQVLLLWPICLGLGWSPLVLGLRFPSNMPLTVLCILGLAFVFLAFQIVLSVMLDFVIRNSSSASFAEKIALLPRTTRERALFVLRALTGGAEELLYRGFLPAYLTRVFPHCSFTWAIVVSALLFGFSHLNQGRSNAIGTGLLGLVYGLLYLITGSILPAILAHVLFNLRLLLISNTRLFETAEQWAKESSSPPS